MRVLFLLAHAGLFRNFESTLRGLAEEGQELHVAFDSERYPSDAFAALLAAHPNVTTGPTPQVPADRWQALGRGVRSASDYLRYLDPRYADAPKLRARARRAVPAWARWAIRPTANRARLDRRLRRVERALPLRPAMTAFLRERAPDLLVVSPLFGSDAQLEALRAARRLGIPSCHAVASWDNLTNKGLIRELPDTLVVWNEGQKREAVELHGVPAERVAVTGAQNFDEWFARSPSSTPQEFAGRLGLRADRPYLLYLGSSSFIAPKEADFAVAWLRAVRASAALRDVGVLFRPHPQNARQWERPDLLDDAQVAIYPPPADAPQQTGRADWSREDFYDSMHHAAAVIGVNTTAMIESAVLGRGVYTVLAPEFRETQEGTLHFAHLRSAGGGLLHEAPSLEAHVAQLERAVAEPGPSERSRRFVEAFVRPYGLEEPATPRVLAALAAAAGVRPEAAPAPGRAPALEPLAAIAYAGDRLAGARRRKRKRGRRGRVLRRRLRQLLPVP